MNIYNEDGWLFARSNANEVHDITGELRRLFELADEDDRWAERVRQKVEEREETEESFSRFEWFMDELHIVSGAGAVVPQPYGGYSITFPSKRHLFRGENRRYAVSVPSLNRAVGRIKDPREKELCRVIAHMRKWQFADLLWQIDVVPRWEAELCDVNFDALAQHYGFQTHLLDLTNDFRTALFFAVTKYDAATDSYFPLTEADIERSEDTRYGYLYHTPGWCVDSMQSSGMATIAARCGGMFFSNEKMPRLQSGIFDGVAIQIGYQPLYRCHCQSGYLYSARNGPSLQEDKKFEKMRFRHSAALSACVYESMDRGRKAFPNEGVSEIQDLLKELKHSTAFSAATLAEAYEEDIDRALFPTIDELRTAIQGYRSPDGTIEIRDEEIIKRIPQELLDKVNAHYDGKDLWEQIGGRMYIKPGYEEYQRQRWKEIYTVSKE